MYVQALDGALKTSRRAGFFAAKSIHPFGCAESSDKRCLELGLFKNFSGHGFFKAAPPPFHRTPGEDVELGRVWVWSGSGVG